MSEGPESQKEWPSGGKWIGCSDGTTFRVVFCPWGQMSDLWYFDGQPPLISSPPFATMQDAWNWCEMQRQIYSQGQIFSRAAPETQINHLKSELQKAREEIEEARHEMIQHAYQKECETQRCGCYKESLLELTKRTVAEVDKLRKNTISLGYVNMLREQLDAAWGTIDRLHRTLEWKPIGLLPGSDGYVLLKTKDSRLHLGIIKNKELMCNGWQIRKPSKTYTHWRSV